MSFLSDTQNLNLINSICAKTPSYDLTGRLPYVGFYITCENKLIIEGIFDNNYISWFSVSSLQDKELNAQIFNYIAAGEHRLVSSEAAVIDANDLGDILKYSFFGKLTRRPLNERKTDNAQNSTLGWNTPFGAYYGGDFENHGRYFANDILRFAKKLKTQAEFKVADGKYNAILIEYLKRISEIDYMNYEAKIKPVYEALLSEKYLAVSQNAETRRLYTDCIDACESKYNSYMTVARG